MAASYRSPSAKKRALAPAHEEMKRKGFLAKVSFPDKHTARYEVAEDFVMARTFLERRWTPEEETTIRGLISNNVRAGGARELVATKGTVLCNYYLRALPYQKWVRDPGGFLYKYISKEKPLDVEPPQRFLEEAEIVPDYGDLAPVAGMPAAPMDEAPTPDAKPEDVDERPTSWKPDAQTGAAAEDLWRRVLQDLDGKIDATSLRVWFGSCQAISLADGRLTVEVPNPFAKEYIETRFGELLESSLKERLSKKASLRVVVGVQPEQ
jgi:hypothetical protein